MLNAHAHRQAIGAKQIMIMVFFNAKKALVFNVFPRGTTFNQLYFSNGIFPDLKIANLNFRRQKIGSTFRVHMDNSNCHNQSKVTSSIRKNHVSRMIYSLYSPDIGPCDFWLFGMSMYDCPNGLSMSARLRESLNIVKSRRNPFETGVRKYSGLLVSIWS
jgi:hypothetical protein